MAPLFSRNEVVVIFIICVIDNGVDKIICLVILYLLREADGQEIRIVEHDVLQRTIHIFLMRIQPHLDGEVLLKDVLQFVIRCLTFHALTTAAIEVQRIVVIQVLFLGFVGLERDLGTLNGCARVIGDLTTHQS